MFRRRAKSKPEKARSLLQIPNRGTGKGVFHELVHIQEKTMGIGLLSQFDRETGTVMLEVLIQRH